MDETSGAQSWTSLDHTSKVENIGMSPLRGHSVEAVKAEVKAQQVDEYPDRGLMAWLTIAGATACLFVSFGWVNLVSTF